MNWAQIILPPMRVHIDASRALTSAPTGIHLYTQELIAHLPAIAPQHEYILYAPVWLRPHAAHIFPQLPACVRWEWLRWRPRVLWTQLCLASAWWRAARRGSPAQDIFFAPAHVAPFFSPRPLYVTVHDLGFLVVPAAYSPFARIFMRLMMKRNCKQATRILTISATTKNLIYTSFRIAGDKIVVTPLAPPRATTQTPAGDLPTQLNNTTYVLSVGRIEWKKGTDHLVRAFDRTADKHTALLVLVGQPGVGYERVRRRIHHAQARRRIVELGYVDAATLAALYAHAALCVVASRYEGFGMHALEAFHHGAPLVARHGSAIPEVAGDAAQYFSTRRELGNAIADLLHDADACAALRTRGREQLKLFSWERTARLTAQALNLI